MNKSRLTAGGLIMESCFVSLEFISYEFTVLTLQKELFFRFFQR
jgi:hypothetical protein